MPLSELMGDKESKTPAEIVKTFYDTYGWKRDEASGRLQGYVLHADVDETVESYGIRNEMRYRHHFKDGGGFFLDSGCGGSPRRYMSQDFSKHVCADISIAGLAEARSQLGEFGSYVLADLSALPFKDKSFGGTLASHCLYHVDKELQPVVLKELYRVTGAGKSILIFYSSRSNLVSLLHKVPALAVTLVRPWLARLGLQIDMVPPYLKRAGKHEGQAMDTPPALYAYPYNPAILAKDLESAEITCLMTLTKFDTEALRKLRVLRLVLPIMSFLERRFPHAMIYVGKYTCIRISRGD